MALSRVEGMITDMIRHARRRDKAMGSFDEDLQCNKLYCMSLLVFQKCKCVWCAVDLEYEHGPNQISLDRVDNSKAHLMTNCVLACLSCNHKRCKV